MLYLLNIAQNHPLHAHGYFDEKTSNDTPKFKQAREFVHFHSFSSCLPFTSSITSGTQPPNTNILRNKKRNILSFVIYSTHKKNNNMKSCTAEPAEKTRRKVVFGYLIFLLVRLFLRQKVTVYGCSGVWGGGVAQRLGCLT